MQSRYGQSTDVYTAAQLAATGLLAGQVYEVPNSPTRRMLVRNNPSGSSILAGQAVMFTSGYANSFYVDAVTSGVPALGVNDNATTLHTGDTILVGYYFWVTIKGFAYPNVKTGTSANTLVCPCATAGALDTRTTTNQSNIMLLVANSTGSDAQKAAYIF